MSIVGANQFWDSENPVAIAHRGGTESAPENSIAAFSAAAALGFKYLETDVHVTADGVLVAFHDESLDRVTDRRGLISELPYSEVAAARMADDQPIPTMDELFDAFPDVRFNIDVKADDAVVPFAETLRRHNAIDRVCVAAFSERRMRRVRSLVGPRLCSSASPREVTALLTTATIRSSTDARASGGARTRGAPRYQCLQVPERHGSVKIVTRRFLAAAHKRGLKVQVWTVDDPEDMNRLLDMGVDGIFTDQPSVLKSVLIERGQWD